MSSLQAGRKEYQAGMSRAKLDVFYSGRESARDSYRFGLTGKSSTFCKGYLAYLTKYTKKSA